MLVLEENPLATAVDARPVDYRALMKKVEQLVATLDGAEDEGSTIQSLIESIVVNFRDELGIYGGRLYRRRGTSLASPKIPERT